MGSTWKCSAGALQAPSAGLHAARCRGSEVKQPVIGLGEAHSLASSSHRKITCIAADSRSCGFRSVWSSQSGFGHSLESCRFFNPGCLSLGWSHRTRFPSTCAQNNNGSKSISPDNPLFDSEGDLEYAEKRRNNSVFQDYGKHADGEEPYGDQWGEHVDSSSDSVRTTDSNGGYRNGSNASDLFREDSDSVWPEEERVGGGEEGGSGVSYGSWGEESEKSEKSGSSGSAVSSTGSAADSLAIGGKEPVYQVLEVHPDGDVVQREVSRRQLLRKIAGLRLRDIRSVDPSLWVTNSVPAILVRDQAILLNLGSLRAIGTSESVLIFEHTSVGAEGFMAALLPRLRTASNGQGPIMPFELEVVEAALISRTKGLECMLMDVEPRVMALLKVLPNRYTADVLEELRLGKQALVELAAKAGALRQMLLELLDHHEDIRKMTIMGRTCKMQRANGSIECSIPLDKQSAEDEEEEIEMLLEYYLQRCDSCHGQANKLLDAAKEMEDSIAVNLSSRRLEVSRLELLLQVGTFCSALGALVAGIFGMNLKSYLEEHVMAFYITTAGIIFGGIALFIVMFTYLKGRKIL